MNARDREVSECRDRLLKLLKPGDTVYTVLRHVSRSGMQRSIGTIIKADDGELHDWSGLVSRLLGCRWDDKRGGVIISGGGMDMGFEVVYLLSRYLWPDGVPCTGDDCFSNDHNNRVRPPDSKPWIHSDGGYALRHRWI